MNFKEPSFSLTVNFIAVITMAIVTFTIASVDVVINCNAE